MVYIICVDMVPFMGEAAAVTTGSYSWLQAAPTFYIVRFDSVPWVVSLLYSIGFYSWSKPPRCGLELIEPGTLLCFVVVGLSDMLRPASESVSSARLLAIVFPQMLKTGSYSWL